MRDPAVAEAKVEFKRKARQTRDGVILVGQSSRKIKVKHPSHDVEVLQDERLQLSSGKENHHSATEFQEGPKPTTDQNQLQPSLT